MINYYVLQYCRVNFFHLLLTVSSAELYLVLEYGDNDLAGILAVPAIKFSLSQLKEIMKQLFEGLFCLHEQKVCT